MRDNDELTPEEVDRRARELAQRVMSQPYKPQEWPKKPRPAAKPKGSGDAKPRKRGQAGEAS
jgi:hypothetical protein